jgi:uncharacterized repeat protein (TIGR03803 family)
MLGLIFDSSGNLYGVAGEGGASNAGSVFKLTPSGSSFTEKTLYSFKGGTDGGTPVGSVVMDTSGNLYGTTKLGGANGVGVAYKLTKSGSTFTESVIHAFGGSGDGQYPVGNLIFDSSGNLYGTTEGGGAHGNGQEMVGGVAFKLAPKSGGGWTETIMHSFGGTADGISPRANLVQDTSGNFFGTTFLGGSSSAGVVFKLAPKSGGGWTETIIHNFNPAENFGATDGANPAAGLVFTNGNHLFGTTVGGGDFGGGVAFELSSSGSTWTETVLFPFFFGFFEPHSVYSGLVFDTSGNLYGATLVGNETCCPGFYGTIFELTPNATGYWNEKDIYNFDGTHGSGPAIGSMVFDSSGNLYGATQNGGANKVGAVFKIVP